MKAGLELSIHYIFNDLIDSVVDAFDHAGQDKARLDHVLICIDANHEMRGASVLLSLLLDRVKSAQARSCPRQ